MMRKRVLIPVLLLSFGALALSWKVMTPKGLAASDNSKSTKMEWVTFDKGMELAKKKNRMLVIDFYTDWCHYCKVMDKDTFGNTDVIAYARENVIMAKLNAETDEKFRFRQASYSGRQLAMMFGVTGFPTTVFMSPEGELITSVSGVIAAQDFILILKYLSGKWYEKMKFDEFMAKEKKQGSG